MKGVYCTCQIRGNKGFAGHNRHYTFIETEADKEDKCLRCGHYCIYISEYEIFPRLPLGKRTRKGDVHGYRPPLLHPRRHIKEGIPLFLTKEEKDEIFT